MRPELQDIVNEVSRLLTHPVTLEDRHFNLVAFNSHGAEIDDVRQRSILERRSTPEVRRWFEDFGIATSESAVRTPSVPDLGVLARLCLPARWNGVTYGYLWVIDQEGRIGDAVVPAAMELAERAGALLAQQARTREDLGLKVQDLLSTDRETVERAAEEIDVHGIIRRGVPVAAVEVRVARNPPPSAVAINLWTLPSSVLARTEGDRTVLLVPVTSDDPNAVRDVAQRAWDLYAERLAPEEVDDLVAGIGSPRDDLADLGASWREARLTTRVLESVPSLRPIATWADLGVYRLLACGPENALRGAVIDPAVRRLLEHRDPDLRQTAMTFLDRAGNVQQTARALNVHRQTVYHRLQRIETVTGLDLARGEQRLLLHLGLTLAPLMTRPATSS